MARDRRLERWREAGLIDEATVARITALEEQRRKPWLLYAIGGLGALTVVLGLIAIIAANWEQLGGLAKIGADFVLLATVGFGILRADAAGSAWVRETLVMIFYGLVLASIGLIAQTYHLGGEPWQALVFWTLLSAPLVTRGHSAFLATAFYLGTSAAWIAFLASERLHWDEELLPGLASVPSFTLLLVSAWPWLRTVRPGFASAAARLGWLSLGAAMLLLPQLFYSQVSSREADRFWPSFAIIFVGGALLIAFAPRLLAALAGGAHGPRAAHVLRALVGLLLSIVAAALLSPHDRNGLLAAISFIAVWALGGWLAFETGQRRQLNLATALIGARLIAVYVEVLGSLLSTGLGLLLGGGLTLGLTWVWVRYARRKAPASPAAPEGPPDEPEVTP